MDYAAPLNPADPNSKYQDPPTKGGSFNGQTHYDPDTGNTYEWDGVNTWHSNMAGGIVGQEVVVTKNSYASAQSGGGATGDPTYNNVNTGLGAFGIGWSTKEIMIQGAVADARGISMAKVNNISNIRTLGATGAGYMKVVKGVSTGANLLGAGMTIADGYVNGFQAHHAADLGIQAAIYGIGASIPVAGWIVGGAYFLGDMYFQSTHNGMSITQYYLDGKR